MFQGKGMFWGHLGQHPFSVLLVVDQFSGQLVKKQEAGSGKVELIWEGGSRTGGGEIFLCPCLFQTVPFHWCLPLGSDWPVEYCSFKANTGSCVVGEPEWGGRS